MFCRTAGEIMKSARIKNVGVRGVFLVEIQEELTKRRGEKQKTTEG